MPLPNSQLPVQAVHNLSQQAQGGGLNDGRDRREEGQYSNVGHDTVLEGNHPIHCIEKSLYMGLKLGGLALQGGVVGGVEGLDDSVPLRVFVEE